MLMLMRRVYVRACMRLRACSFGLARGAVEWRRETSGANFNCCLPLPAPVLLSSTTAGAVAGPALTLTRREQWV